MPCRLLSLSTDSEQKIKRPVNKLILSNVNYCKAILVGLPALALALLQYVINVAAYLVADLRPLDHMTDALFKLHRSQ